MKVLFLDIDGVLNRFNPEQVSARIEDELVDRLLMIVNETGCKIVISSSWKASSVLMDFLEEELFPKLPKGCVIGCTPTIIPQVNREFEIQKWLDSNHDVEDYVILDDYDFELKSFIQKRKCVIVNDLKGLSVGDAELAIRMLSGFDFEITVGWLRDFLNDCIQNKSLSYSDKVLICNDALHPRYFKIDGAMTSVFDRKISNRGHQPEFKTENIAMLLSNTDKEIE